MRGRSAQPHLGAARDRASALSRAPRPREAGPGRARRREALVRVRWPALRGDRQLGLHRGAAGGGAGPGSGRPRRAPRAAPVEPGGHQHLGTVLLGDRLQHRAHAGNFCPRLLHVAQGTDQVALQERGVAQVVLGLGHLAEQPRALEVLHGGREVGGRPGTGSLREEDAAAVEVCSAPSRLQPRRRSSMATPNDARATVVSPEASAAERAGPARCRVSAPIAGRSSAASQTASRPRVACSAAMYARLAWIRASRSSSAYASGPAPAARRAAPHLRLDQASSPRRWSSAARNISYSVLTSATFSSASRARSFTAAGPSPSST